MQEPIELPNPPAASAVRPKSDEGSIKETIESIIIAFILAFVFRAFVVEAFVIPTGSMAPTLLGQHIAFHCPQCGYGFTTDTRDKGVTKAGRPVSMPLQGRWVIDARNRRDEPLNVHCPMCAFPIEEQTLRTRPGDRILVLKYLYSLSEPRRWDVVVFRNPQDLSDNYIKRLTGLPNEWLWVGRGNIYTSKDEGKTWQAQVKTEEAQRAVWQPIYHSRYVPLDAGSGRWTSPWRAQAGAWRAEDHGLGFTYAGKDSSDGADGRLIFEFGPYRSSDETGSYPFSRDYSIYNYFAYESLFPYQNPISTEAYAEDLRLAALVTPSDDRAELRLEMQTQALDVRAVIESGQSRRLEIRPAGFGPDEWIVVVGDKNAKLAADRPTEVELWHVDHTITLWIDGERALEYAIPLQIDYEPINPLGPHVQIDRTIFADASFADRIGLKDLDLRGSPNRPAKVAIEVSGPSIKVSDIRLDRDLYYTDAEGRMNMLGTGNRIAKLGPDEFFCMGDNSAQSKDSRRLDGVDEWVRYHTMPPHGTHGPEGVPTGFIPRKLMVGKAFFVYFPAPHSLRRESYPIVPNFGDLRFIR